MNQQKQLVVPSRRLFMGYSATTLSAGAIALLGGNEVLAAESKMDIESDISILNVAVGLEYEGINAYTDLSGFIGPFSFRNDGSGC
jgi:hypothetical protein